ncbi:hypothetical protein D3C87_1877270 [compost metagenome]
MVYFPVKTVVQFDPVRLVEMLAVQLAWGAAFALLLQWVYRRGVTKLHVNGG